MGAPRPGRPPRGRAPVTPPRAGWRAPPGPGAPPGRVPLFTFFGLDAIHAERHEHIKIATGRQIPAPTSPPGPAGSPACRPPCIITVGDLYQVAGGGQRPGPQLP